MEPVKERPTKLIVDCSTGKIETIFLTDEEIFQMNEDVRKRAELTPTEQTEEESLWDI